MRRAVLTIAALSLLLLSGVANAQPALLAPGTHPMWASMALGPAISVKDSGTQFKLIETFGYHPMGRAAGPAIALDVQEGFGNHFTSIEVGPKFLWDIQPVHNLGLYLAPSLMLGYLYYTGAGGGGCYPNFLEGGLYCPGGRPGTSFFDMQFGFEGRLVLADRWLVSFRPFTLDLGIRSDVSMRYDMMFGGGAIF
jgi:hypothetical protein